MRILWHGIHEGFKTGYGRQTALFVPALKAAGHTVAVSCVSDQYNNSMSADGIPHYSCGSWVASVGNQLLQHHIAHFKPDIIISMIDAWVIDQTKLCGVPWYPFVMVDSSPVSHRNVQAFKSTAWSRVLCPTRTAVSEMTSMFNGASDRLVYCPLAIDATVYDIYDRAECRTTLGNVLGRTIGPDTFVAVMNSANHSVPSRKNFAAAIKAWAMADIKDGLLYIHSEMTGKYHNGEDLQLLVHQYRARNVCFVPQYEYSTGLLPDSYLATVYNAADALLCPSWGEGFGLPIVEAMACGCQSIVTDFGAMRELAMVTGIQVRGTMFAREAGSEQCMIDVDELAGAIPVLYKMPRVWRGQIRNTAVGYDIRAVMTNYMIPFLAGVEKEIKR